MEWTTCDDWLRQRNRDGTAIGSIHAAKSVLKRFKPETTKGCALQKKNTVAPNQRQILSAKIAETRAVIDRIYSKNVMIMMNYLIYFTCIYA